MAMGPEPKEDDDVKLPLRGAELQQRPLDSSDETRVPAKSDRYSNKSNGEVHLEVGSRNPDPSDTISWHNRPPLRQRWRKEVLRTVVAFLCTIGSSFLNFFLLTIIHDVVPRRSLPDLVFMLIEQQKWAWALGDVVCGVNLVIGTVCVLMHKERIVVLRRIMLLSAIMYGLRAIVMGVTFLPPSIHNVDEVCRPQVNSSDLIAGEIGTRFVRYVITLGMTSSQDKILCGDLMFSGHTTILALLYFTLLYYTPKKLVLLRCAATPVTFLGIAALVISGGHYTMDVLIAYWLTSHVFWSYHQIFEMPRREREKAPISRIWWFWVCYWFEVDSPPGRIKNEWDWPFSGPKFLLDAFESLNAKTQAS